MPLAAQIINIDDDTVEQLSVTQNVPSNIGDHEAKDKKMSSSQKITAPKEN